MMQGMTHRVRFWTGAVAALLCGLAMRVWFARHYPWLTGDVLVYGAIAKNWLMSGTYGFSAAGGRVAPTLIRLPGYPLFVAVCFRLFGLEHYGSVMYMQIALDLCTCLLISALAGRLAGRRAAVAALWLTALCPFTANYTAAPLTETLSLFCVALGFYGLERWRMAGLGWNRWLWVTAWAMLYAVMLRPDQGLLAAAILPAMLWLQYRGADGRGWRPALPVAAAVLCIVLPFVPWAWRNWHTFHVVQPLAPRYANDPDETVARGFQRWYRTWAIDFDSTEEVYWNYDGNMVNLSDLPSRAFDSTDQYNRTSALLARYNDALSDDPDLEDAFNALASERDGAHPVRSFVLLPLARLADMWLRPRTEMMQIPLEWWQWRGGHVKTALFALGYAALNLAYLVLAGVGLWIWRGRGWSGRRVLGLSMLAFVALRCLLLTTLDNSEPRYVLECWPVVTLLAAMTVARWGSRCDEVSA
jgi:hypothetical protein